MSHCIAGSGSAETQVMLQLRRFQVPDLTAGSDSGVWEPPQDVQLTAVLELLKSAPLQVSAPASLLPSLFPCFSQLSLDCWPQVADQLHVVELLVARLVDRGLVWACLHSSQGKRLASCSCWGWLTDHPEHALCGAGGLPRPSSHRLLSQIDPAWHQAQVTGLELGTFSTLRAYAVRLGLPCQ